MDIERKIKIKDAYLKLIIDLSVGYDGYENDINGLKSLIDTFSEYSVRALKNDDKCEISVNGNKKYNILGELLNEKTND